MKTKSVDLPNEWKAIIRCPSIATWIRWNQETTIRDDAPEAKAAAQEQGKDPESETEAAPPRRRRVSPEAWAILESVLVPESVIKLVDPDGKEWRVATDVRLPEDMKPGEIYLPDLGLVVFDALASECLGMMAEAGRGPFRGDNASDTNGA